LIRPLVAVDPRTGAQIIVESERTVQRATGGVKRGRPTASKRLADMIAAASVPHAEGTINSDKDQTRPPATPNPTLDPSAPIGVDRVPANTRTGSLSDENADRGKPVKWTPVDGVSAIPLPRRRPVTSPLPDIRASRASDIGTAPDFGELAGFKKPDPPPASRPRPVTTQTVKAPAKPSVPEFIPKVVPGDAATMPTGPTRGRGAAGAAKRALAAAAKPKVIMVRNPDYVKPRPVAAPRPQPKPQPKPQPITVVDALRAKGMTQSQAYAAAAASAHRPTNAEERSQARQSAAESEARALNNFSG
jgi:hypothetical protein